MDKVLQGDMTDDSTPEKLAREENGQTATQTVDFGLEPPPSMFIMNMPNISSIDLCVFTPLISFVVEFVAVTL